MSSGKRPAAPRRIYNPDRPDPVPQKFDPGPDFDYRELQRNFLVPFRGKNFFRNFGQFSQYWHLNQEWVGDKAIRVRVFNGGFIPENFSNYRNRYCIGVAAVRSSIGLHFLAEMHTPLPLKDPHSFAIRFVPARREIKMLRQPIGQLNLLEDTPAAQDAIAAKEHMEQADELEQLLHIITDVLPQSSKYMEKFRAVKSRDEMRKTRFLMNIFHNRRDARRVEKEEFADMWDLIYPGLAVKIRGMGEDNPLYLSEEEGKRLDSLTSEFNRSEALKMVLKGERYRRFVAAEARQRMQQSFEEADEERRAREAAVVQQHEEELLDLLRDPDIPDSAPPEDTRQ